MPLRKSPREAPLHFRRMELKYLLPERHVPRLIECILPYTHPDPYLVAEGKGRTHYPVTSLYFDSIDLQSLTEKDAGLLARRKLRLRTYEEEFSETKPCFLEIKRRHDFIVSKDRLSLSVGHLSAAHSMPRLLGHLLARVEASEEVTAEAQMLRGIWNLQPTALVRYERTPFVGAHDRKFRITVDRDLCGLWEPPSLIGAFPLMRCMEGYVVIELKCNHAIPEWFHATVQDLELQRISYSKYAMVGWGLRPSLFEDHVPLPHRLTVFC